MQERSYPSPELRRQRMELALFFLKSVLIPYLNQLDEDASLDQVSLDKLEAEYKNTYQILGSDFTMDHVWALSWSILKNAQEQPNATNESDLAQVKRAWAALTALQTPSKG